MQKPLIISIIIASGLTSISLLSVIPTFHFLPSYQAAALEQESPEKAIPGIFNTTSSPESSISTQPQQKPPSKIPDGSITTSKLADGAVTTPKIANDAITADKISGVSKLLFTSCTSNFNPITPGLGDFGHCSVPGAEVGDMVMMGASRNDPGAGNLLVHLAYVDSPGQITFFVRSFGTNNFPATI